MEADFHSVALIPWNPPMVSQTVDRAWHNLKRKRNYLGAPGVGMQVRGGITFREAHLAMEMIADSRKMLGFEVVEVNPILDALNKTAIPAVGLAVSTMGKRIV